ncbi:Hypothetical protein PHPALM_11199 [Phytophthora palmivora]|uniref:Uncharacterized protein n=1 Tax=Phytophthora palmivora TaxID=4796 RepID=A0A2P4Y363_9STRA|nr:Hypothetical protein PHPALM_11199 [Phytophthora palmivora]
MLFGNVSPRCEHMIGFTSRTILHQSRNTMTPHQFQKFLSWSMENRPSIDQLQFVPTASTPESEKDLTFIFSED